MEVEEAEENEEQDEVEDDDSCLVGDFVSSPAS